MVAFDTDGTPLAVMVVDIDHFKSINDEYGHQVGDRCIVAAVRRCRWLSFGRRSAPRIRGEEFAVFNASAPEDAAIAPAGLYACLWQTSRSRSKAARCHDMQLGVCSMTAGRNGRPDIAMRRADQALYWPNVQAEIEWARPTKMRSVMGSRKVSERSFIDEWRTPHRSGMSVQQLNPRMRTQTAEMFSTHNVYYG